jgi:hypothetical protein
VRSDEALLISWSCSLSVRMPRQDGLVVTVSPNSSAYFAGEVFTATVTLTNSYTPPPPPPQAGTFASQQQHYPRSPSGTSQRTVTPTSYRNRPPSGNQAEYGTQHLDGGELPASPYLRTPSGPSYASASTSQLPSPSTPPRRNPYDNTLTGHALATPHSAAFTNPSSPIRGSTSDRPLPMRRGLIGKPIAKEPPKAVGGALYAGGPRRPGGGLLRGHGRAQSMAISSPDLLARGGGSENGNRHASAPLAGRAHAKSRFGGSVAGPAMENGFANEHPQPSSPLRGTLLVHFLLSPQAHFAFSRRSSSSRRRRSRRIRTRETQFP